MSARAQAIILCEDKQHEAFLRRVLRELGYSRHRVRVRPYPSGRGCGYAHVRDNFACEVEEQRRRNTHVATDLLVAADADNRTVAAVHTEFAGELSDARRADERIAVYVAKWCFDTWIGYLTGNTEITEQEQHPPDLRGRESECAPAVIEYLRLAAAGTDTGGRLPSLDASFAEHARIAGPG